VRREKERLKRNVHRERETSGTKRVSEKFRVLKVTGEISNEALWGSYADQ